MMKNLLLHPRHASQLIYQAVKYKVDLNLVFGIHYKISIDYHESLNTLHPLYPIYFTIDVIRPGKNEVLSVYRVSPNEYARQGLTGAKGPWPDHLIAFFKNIEAKISIKQKATQCVKQAVPRSAKVPTPHEQYIRSFVTSFANVNPTQHLKNNDDNQQSLIAEIKNRINNIQQVVDFYQVLLYVTNTLPPIDERLPADDELFIAECASSRRYVTTNVCRLNNMLDSLKKELLLLIENPK